MFTGSLSGNKTFRFVVVVVGRVTRRFAPRRFPLNLNP